MKKLKLNQKGFSLVELMVVVAIIGILATIGIPQYQKFMAKARQAEAKTHLNSIFQGEASHFTEYNAYTTNLNVLGTAASGNQLRYNAGFDDTTNAGLCLAPTALTPAATVNTNDMLTICANSAAAVCPVGTYATIGNAAIADVGAFSNCDNGAAGGPVFTAVAWGNPTNNNAAPNNATNNQDVFTMTNARVLTHARVGM